MLPFILLAAVTLGGLYLIDKGFSRTFRGKAQHKTGLSVRLNKRTGVFGVILCVLAVAVLITDFGDSRTLMRFAGLFIAVMGLGLSVYYMSFGIFYDGESFIHTAFGKGSVTYAFSQIVSQQLYVTTGGGIIVELHMDDGKAISLHSGMEGVYPFLDKAFYAWCQQKGLDPDQCDFYDPKNSCWFPSVEG